MPVVARLVMSNQGPPSVEVTRGATLRGDEAGRGDVPQGQSAPLDEGIEPTVARPTPGRAPRCPWNAVTRTALRTASSRRANPSGGSAREMTPSTRSPSGCVDGLAVQPCALAQRRR